MTFIRTLKKAVYLAFITLSVVHSTHAQSTTTVAVASSSASEKNQAIVLATINLNNLRTDKVSTSTYTVSFSLTNTGSQQSGIYYLFSLLEKDGGVLTTKTFDKPLTLEKNIPKFINETFILPKGLNGTYTIRVQALTEAGLPVGGAISSPITVKDPELIKLTVCTHDKNSYTENQVLKLDCQINEIKKGTLASGNYIVHARVFYNNQPFEKQSVLGEITSKASTIEIKNMVSPGKYTIHTSLEERSGLPVGKEVSTLFTVNGVSVSILNLLLNKEIYAQGENARATIALSITSEGTSTPLTLTSALTGKEGVCSNYPPIDLLEKKALQIDIPVIKTCTDPSLTIRITDGTDKILAEKIVTMKSPVVVPPVSQNAVSLKIPLYAGGAIGILILLVLGEVFVFRKMQQTAVLELATNTVQSAEPKATETIAIPENKPEESIPTIEQTTVQSAEQPTSLPISIENTTPTEIGQTVTQTPSTDKVNEPSQSNSV